MAGNGNGNANGRICGYIARHLRDGDEEVRRYGVRCMFSLGTGTVASLSIALPLLYSLHSSAGVRPNQARDGSYKAILP
jgi:hypothetical protein